jgi:hypothetical protein
MSETQQRTAAQVDPRLTTFDFDTPVAEWSDAEAARLFDVLADQDHMAISEPLSQLGWGGQS